jgi:hypothetical protein
MKILITGSTGLVGSALIPNLVASGHEVIRAVRRPTQGPGEVYWNPEAGEVAASRLSGIDAAINLAGENIFGKWTEEKKKRIYDSRVVGSRKLAEAMAQLDPKPRVLIIASATGFYGDRGADVMTEDSSPGNGFLVKVCSDNEEATAPASENGIRVVKFRLGIVLTKKGGALAKMLTPFKLGIGGKIGSGDQYMSWIAIDDLLSIIENALASESLYGPVNAVAPNAVTNLEFTKTLGRALSRPTIFPVPAFAMRLIFGKEMADETLLASTRVEPRRLIEDGYKFKYSSLDGALRHLLN